MSNYNDIEFVAKHGDNNNNNNRKKKYLRSADNLSRVTLRILVSLRILN